MITYHPPITEIWTGRAAEKPLYWHQNISLIDLESTKDSFPAESHVLLGYAVDEGVLRNLGRKGAAAGPQMIRKSLGGMAWHHGKKHVYDAGDILLEGLDLESVHSLVTEKVAQIFNENGKPILLGGGHDLALAHFRAIKDSRHTAKKIGIINLDAHFDLRKPEGRMATSGTPFYQIKNDWPDTEYLVLGIQQCANNAELFEAADHLQTQYMLAEDFSLANWAAIQSRVDKFIDKVDAIYLTIDMDGFSSAYAPGVSAPSALGFEPTVVLKVIDYLKTTNKLISVDIVECNPDYDRDGRTSGLASQLIFRLTI